jgi:hypothetical protein
MPNIAPASPFVPRQFQSSPVPQCLVPLAIQSASSRTRYLFPPLAFSFRPNSFPTPRNILFLTLVSPRHLRSPNTLNFILRRIVAVAYNEDRGSPIVS